MVRKGGLEQPNTLNISNLTSREVYQVPKMPHFAHPPYKIRTKRRLNLLHHTLVRPLALMEPCEHARWDSDELPLAVVHRFITSKFYHPGFVLEQSHDRLRSDGVHLGNLFRSVMVFSPNLIRRVGISV